MMRRRTFRRPQRKFVVACCLVTLFAIVVVRSMASRLAAASKGADPIAAFHPAMTPVGDIEAVVTWLPDAPTGRPMEPSTRVEITRSYAAAWATLDRAAQGDPAAPIEAYFSGSAVLVASDARLAGESSAVDSPAVVVESVTRHLRHRLRLTSYSDDGSIVGVDVEEMVTERFIDPAGSPVVDRSVDRMRLVMVLEDGRWRVRLMERTESVVR